MKDKPVRVRLLVTELTAYEAVSSPPSAPYTVSVVMQMIIGEEAISVKFNAL